MGGQRPTDGCTAEQAHLLRSILDNIAEGVVVADTAGFILVCNPAARRIVGMTPDATLSELWERHECFLPDRRTPFPPEQLPLRQALRGVAVDHVEVFFRSTERPDGVWVSVNARPLSDDRGAVWGGVVVFRDVSESRRTAERLRRADRARLAITRCNQAVVRAADEPSLLREVCRVIVEVAGYRLCWAGYAEHDEHKTVRPVAQAGYEEGYLKTVNVTWSDTERGHGPGGTAIRTGRPAVFQDVAADPCFAPWLEEALKRGYASAVGIPLPGEGGPLGALLIYASEPDAFDDEEVGLLRSLADDLAFGIKSLRTRIEHARAEAASQAKGIFLANVSHEIRTPLNGILGLTELVLESDLSPQQQRNLELVHQSAETLLGILNDILDFSKIEAGRLELEQRDFSLRRTVGDALKILAPRAHDKGLELACRVAADVPDGLIGDPLRLRQVLLNLVGNAIKFTRQGEVVLSVSLASATRASASRLTSSRSSSTPSSRLTAPSPASSAARGWGWPSAPGWSPSWGAASRWRASPVGAALSRSPPLSDAGPGRRTSAGRWGWRTFACWLPTTTLPAVRSWESCWRAGGCGPPWPKAPPRPGRSCRGPEKRGSRSRRR